MNWLDYLIIILAVLYSAEVIATKGGPFNVFSNLRTRAPLGGLTSCVWCLWPWLSVVFCCIYYLCAPVVVVFAVAGGAAVLRSYTGVRHDD
jgi:hypothetical protein